MHQIIRNIKAMILVLMFVSTASAQQGDWRITLNLADSLMKIGSIYTAIDYYETIIKQGYELPYIEYKLGHAHLAARDYDNAQHYFKKVFENAPKQYPEAEYFYAITKKHEQEYLEAYDLFENIKANYKGPSESRYKKWARTEMEACLQGDESMQNPEKVEIKRLNNTMNTNHSEMSMEFMDKGRIVYTAIKTEGILTNDFMQYSKLYYAAKVGNEWKHQRDYVQFEPGPDEHIAHLCVSPTGKAMYYTICKTNDNLQMECAIYRSTYEESILGWGDPTKLGNRVNIKNYISTHPTIGLINDSTEVLYLTSNRPGGVGGFDIWFSIWKDGSFSAPVNLGKKVNTNHDEFSPYYDNKNSTLYFSSKGHLGFGGYDIFKSTGEGKKWTSPENLKYPINSSYDDIYFKVKNNEGFIVSNRTGSLSPSHPHCCDDMYSFKIKDTSVAYANIDLFYEEFENKPFDGEVDITLYQLDKKDRTEIKLENFTTDKNKLNFVIKPNYLYRVKAYNNVVRYFYTGYVKFDTYDARSGDTINTKLLMRQIVLNKPYGLSISYPEPSSTELTDDAKAKVQKLIKFMRDNPDIIIELASHTSDIESNAKKISEQRAENVKDYLMERGISSQSIITKGFGATRPLAPNKNKDGSINVEGRKINDRVEYKIIGGTVQ